MTTMTYKPPILISGPPGAGKTSSLMSLKPELAKRTLLINLDDKDVPWIGKTHFKDIRPDCVTQLPTILKKAGESGLFDMAVLDTINTLADTYARNFINAKTPQRKVVNGKMKTNERYVASTEKVDVEGNPYEVVDSRAGWGYYSALLEDTISAAKKSGMQVVAFGHLAYKGDEDGEEFKYRCNLQGRLGKVGIEKLFTVAWHSSLMPLGALEDQDHKFLDKVETIPATNSRHVFQVQLNADTADTHLIRSPAGMFPPNVTFINNDLDMVFDHIQELFQ